MPTEDELEQLLHMNEGFFIIPTDKESREDMKRAILKHEIESLKKAVEKVEDVSGFHNGGQ